MYSKYSVHGTIVTVIGSSVLEHLPSKQCVCRGLESLLNSSFSFSMEKEMFRVSCIALL